MSEIYDTPSHGSETTSLEYSSSEENSSKMDTQLRGSLGGNTSSGGTPRETLRHPLDTSGDDSSNEAEEGYGTKSDSRSYGTKSSPRGYGTPIVQLNLEELLYTKEVLEVMNEPADTSSVDSSLEDTSGEESPHLSTSPEDEETAPESQGSQESPESEDLESSGEESDEEDVVWCPMIPLHLVGMCGTWIAKSCVTGGKALWDLSGAHSLFSVLSVLPQTLDLLPQTFSLQIPKYMYESAKSSTRRSLAHNLGLETKVMRDKYEISYLLGDKIYRTLVDRYNPNGSRISKIKEFRAYGFQREITHTEPNYASDEITSIIRSYATPSGDLSTLNLTPYSLGYDVVLIEYGECSRAKITEFKDHDRITIY